MKPVAFLLLCISLSARQTVPIPAAEVSLRKEIYQDTRVRVFLLDIPPGHATLLHRHDRDMLSVFVTGGRTRAVFNGGAPVDDTFAVGDVRFRSAGFTHSTENRDTVNFLSVIFEFVEPQGERVALTRRATRTCAAGDRADCVEERPVLCTTKFCVDDVSLAPQAAREERATTTDRMMVAVSRYTLSEQSDGATATIHDKKSGDVELITAGPARRWTNTATTAARYIVVSFR